METGIDEFDELEGTQDPLGQEQSDNTSGNQSEEQSDNQSSTEKDFLDQLLEQRGISNKNEIQFQNDDGEIENRSWDTLSNQEKLNIVNSLEDDNNKLDNNEIQLINAIRQSGMTPSEYFQYIENNAVARYNSNAQQPQYTVDQYSDDDLYKADLVSKGATEEEAEEALASAKSNETLFKKQIGAMRQEYKNIENENLRQAQFEQEQQAQAQYNQFAQNVVNEISNFKEFSGYDLNMENADMQELYDFITGTDAAGNNYFAKALADPKILVQTAWFALNGKQMIDDITDYYKKEISNVRKTSYEKGLAEGRGDQSQVVFKNKTNHQSKQNTFDDLDDF